MKCKKCEQRQAPPGYDVCEICTLEAMHRRVDPAIDQRIEEYFSGPVKSKTIYPCPKCAELRAANEALRQRLEIIPEAPEYDGISCRDETIKALEKQVADLKLALESDYR